jgi:glycosyltransferase involved in cell wall biosynthesis
MRKRSLVCLLPVRNGATDLPDYLKCVSRFADAVVALDDGSTDDTRDLLAASPLVEVLLSNPRRNSYREWDDGMNRNRLLEAAAQLDPTWILSLDADERFDAEDAAALRRFVEEEAVPGFAFGFPVFRMWHDIEHYEPVGYWVYRLFAFEPGQRFPDRRLHFDPIPMAIPRARWLRTTLRIQHLASLTPQRRAARLEKYQQADPDQASQYRYPDLADTANEVVAWQARSSELPVLAAAGGTAAESAAPALSAIVISRDDEARIARTVSSIVGQACEWPFEVIVVTSGRDRTAEIVRQEFPEVTLIELPEPALPGRARNAGLRVARGDYVSFPGSHIELPQGSLSARIRAHDLGYAMVTGTTLNGTRTRAGWAAYFLDHSSVLPGRPSTELPGPPAHCSYLREALIDVGGFSEELRAGEDTVVNSRLASNGYNAYRAQDVTLIHHNRCQTAPALLGRFFVRGRAYARILLERHRQHGRLLRQHRLRSLYRRQVSSRRETITRHVETWGGEDLRLEYRRAKPLVKAATTAYWLGTCYELLRPGRAKPFLLWGKPVIDLVATDSQLRSIDGKSATHALARVDVATRRAKLIRLAGDLVAPHDDEREQVDLEVIEALAQRRGSLLSRIPETVAMFRRARRSGLAMATTLTLTWAVLTIDPADVHMLAVAEDAASDDKVLRCLDTRNFRERQAPITCAPAHAPSNERPDADGTPASNVESPAAIASPSVPARL